jgi:hypothetical protein
MEAKLRGWKSNKTKLLKTFGYKSIRGFRKDNEFNNDAEAYAYLLQEYNNGIEELNKNYKIQQKTYLRQNVKSYKPDINRIYEEIKKNKGKSLVISYIKGKRTIKTKTYDIPIQNYKNWYDNQPFRYDWLGAESPLYIWDEAEGGMLYFYEENDNISNKKIEQFFREGITNCLLTPIHIWAEEKLEESKSNTSKKTYSRIIKNLIEYSKKYVKGVPQNDIPEICNKLQIDITIETPFSDKKLIECESIKKRLKKFSYINSRINHIDLNEIVINDKPTEVSRKELLEIEKKLIDEEQYYTYKKDMVGISKINTLTNCYSIKSDYSETVNNFEIENGLHLCKLDDIADKEISEFVRCGTHYNETIDFMDITTIDIDKTKSSDMTKAYASFKSCKYYNGFLGKITDFRKTNKIMGVGMYLITNLVISEGLFKQYNDKMKMYVTDNIYTDAELKMLVDNNCKFKIVGGCWGVNPIDFEFNEDMLTKKEEIYVVDEKTIKKVPYYSKWAGSCYSKFLKKTFWIKGDENMRNIIRDYTNAEVKQFWNGEIRIEYDKKQSNHLSHITAFITAYMRLNVIEQLLNMDIQQIIRVCVDGIYHYGDVEYKNVFREKNDIRLGNDAGISYCSNIHTDLKINFGDERKNYAKELHLGAGGCGKTHYNINDIGLVRKMYLSPSWKLARNKRNECGINVSVWARAITEDPIRITEIKSRANVLIFDEVSMMSEFDKEKIFKTYGDMKLIFCGDLGYQLPCIEGIEMDKKGFNNTVKHNKDFRCEDERLKQIKEDLRLMISYGRSIREINKWCMDEFKKYDRIITVDKLKEMYEIDDMILTGTNSLKDYYTKLFDGKFQKKNKYYVTNNNRLWSNGDIVIGEKPIKTSCEVRHAFTTHSIQGETAKFNLFIDSSKMFESRMFYTAISRAKRLEQIYLIEPNEEMLEMNKKKIEIKN